MLLESGNSHSHHLIYTSCHRSLHSLKQSVAFIELANTYYCTCRDEHTFCSSDRSQHCDDHVASWTEKRVRCLEVKLKAPMFDDSDATRILGFLPHSKCPGTLTELVAALQCSASTTSPKNPAGVTPTPLPVYSARDQYVKKEYWHHTVKSSIICWQLTELMASSSRPAWTS